MRENGPKAAAKRPDWTFCPNFGLASGGKSDYVLPRARAPQKRLRIMETALSTTWNTKFGSRRLKVDLPTLEEAIFAASGITDDREGQAEIAAALMGMPLDEVRTAVMKVKIVAEPVRQIIETARRGPRVVVVEQKSARRKRIS